MNNDKYRLLDTPLWAQADHLKPTPGLARKASQNPLFGEELPWEVRHDNLYAKVIFDRTDNFYKCWYNPFIIDAATTDTPPAQRERGAEGSFDWGCIYAAAYPFLKDGRLQLYYGGSDGPHTDWRAAYLGLATLRPDGFAGLTPVNKTQTATLVTQPVQCSGRQLRLNQEAPRSGQMVRSALVGREIQIFFELRDATLYSFSFSD